MYSPVEKCVCGIMCESESENNNGNNIIMEGKDIC